MGSKNSNNISPTISMSQPLRHRCNTHLSTKSLKFTIFISQSFANLYFHSISLSTFMLLCGCYSTFHNLDNLQTPPFSPLLPVNQSPSHLPSIQYSLYQWYFRSSRPRPCCANYWKSISIKSPCSDLDYLCPNLNRQVRQRLSEEQYNYLPNKCHGDVNTSTGEEEQLQIVPIHLPLKLKRMSPHLIICVHCLYFYSPSIP